MKLGNSFIPANSLVSSPFVRWQGALAEISSLDLAVSVGKSALLRSQLQLEDLGSLVLGWTVPQPAIFYGAPWVAARIGATGISGPMVSQACATAVACLQSAAAVVQADARATVLAIAADRTSNGPSLLYPAPSSAGGSPIAEHWVLDNFRRDPWTAEAMISTAEHVARDCRATREELDDLTQLRFEQYQTALADDRRLQRQYMVGIDIPGPKRSVRSIDQDAGVHATTREGLAALKPVQPGGVMTYGSQTHPADGAAAALVCGEHQARSLARGDGLVQLLASGFARAPAARMPKAATSAAEAALGTLVFRWPISIA